ncbi:hypothetical protein MASR2M78_03300 [Treponema sp.]
MGDDLGTMEQTLRLVTDADKAFYEYVFRSKSSEGLQKIDAANLFCYYSDITTRSPDAILRKTSEVLQSLAKWEADELVVSDFNSLNILLRGYPFTSLSNAKVAFLGTGGNTSNFTFGIKLTGTETLNLAGKKWNCYKMEMGLGGFLGGFFKKTNLWFAVEAPHILVRFEGVQGPPGSPVRILEIQKYSIVQGD